MRVILGLQIFSLVEFDVFRRHFWGDNIYRNKLVKYIHLLSEKVEQKIKVSLPQRFANFFSTGGRPDQRTMWVCLRFFHRESATNMRRFYFLFSQFWTNRANLPTNCKIFWILFSQSSKETFRILFNLLATILVRTVRFQENLAPLRRIPSTQNQYHCETKRSYRKCKNWCAAFRIPFLLLLCAAKPIWKRRWLTRQVEVWYLTCWSVTANCFPILVT